MLRSRSKPLPHPFFCTLCPPPCRASDKTAARPCSLLNTPPARPHLHSPSLPSSSLLLLLLPPLLPCLARPAPHRPLTSLGCYLRYNPPFASVATDASPPSPSPLFAPPPSTVRAQSAHPTLPTLFGLRGFGSLTKPRRQTHRLASRPAPPLVAAIARSDLCAL
jgi:hypothetical protein